MKNWKRRLAVGAVSVAMSGGFALAVSGAANATTENAPISVADVCDGAPGCSLGPYPTRAACIVEQSTMARYYTITMQCFDVDHDQWKFSYKNKGT